MKYIVVIDGNNLAHEKYTIPSREVPPDVAQKLISRLEIWAKTHKEEFKVKLVFDPFRIDSVDARYCKVHIADIDDDADNVIMDYAGDYGKSNCNCIVVTNDTLLRQKVNALGVRSIRSAAFAKMSKTGDEFSLPEEWSEDGEILNTQQAPILNSVMDPGDISSGKIKTAEKNTFPNQPIADDRVLKSVNEQDKRVMVRLNIKHWPIKESAQFLIKSACPRHRHLYKSIWADQKLDSDARVNRMFKLFSVVCKSERDLIDRGGCLMDKVRLFLINKYPNPAYYFDLEESLNVKTGVMSKLKKNDGKWVELFEG